jgi:ribonucleoside-diphosphate reductase alpha chain
VLGYEYLGRTDLVHVLDKPEVLNSGADEWDEIPSNPLEYVEHELSSVRVTPASQSNQQTVKHVHEKKMAVNAKAEGGFDAVNAATKGMQSDAPACGTCGHIMMRSGTCYKCNNCGAQGGCS